MRLPTTATLLSLASLLLPTALASDREHWASLAASSPDGIITLNTESYDDLLSNDRDYGVTVVLTAMPQQFKCQPCHEFDPVYRNVARSWRRIGDKEKRDSHFFALLDFGDGQAVYQRLQLTAAPTVYYFPPVQGEKGQKDGKVLNYDLNRAGLSINNLMTWVRSTTPAQFEVYTPMSPVPFIVAPLVVAMTAFVLWSARAVVVPILQSRFVWGVSSVIACLVFTSGYMWNKIKGAPYVAASQDGKLNWIAGGYSNQYGLESQVVGLLYGVLALCILVLSVLIPSQSSPTKQRIGTLLWLAMVIVLFSLLIRMFKIKNGSYPFTIL